MDYRKFAAALKSFIVEQEDIAGRWSGDLPGAAEDNAHEASRLIELAQPLLGELRALIANEDFVPPQK